MGDMPKLKSFSYSTNRDYQSRIALINTHMVRTRSSSSRLLPLRPARVIFQTMKEANRDYAPKPLLRERRANGDKSG